MASNTLIILCGIPFSGKTTLAKFLESQNVGVRIDLDDIKFELLGSAVKDEEVTQEQWDTVYKKMYEIIETELHAGRTVIHDTGNFTKYEREQVKKIAKKLKLETKIIFLDVPTAIALERLEENRKIRTRFNISDKSFEDAVEEMEKPELDENVLYINEHDNIEKVLEFLQ